MLLAGEWDWDFGFGFVFCIFGLCCRGSLRHLPAVSVRFDSIPFRDAAQNPCEVVAFWQREGGLLVLQKDGQCC